uniref:Uncharacterized protein n=1 Tax=Oryza nivara TaxID=4536 RepID=A0A0E0GBI2_ORYNI
MFLRLSSRRASPGDVFCPLTMTSSLPGAAAVGICQRRRPAFYAAWRAMVNVPGQACMASIAKGCAAAAVSAIIHLLHRGSGRSTCCTTLRIGQYSTHFS